MSTCHYCQKTEGELRPYGPNGEIVCFACGTSTPERRAVAMRAIHAKLDACDGRAVLVGNPDGPRPGPAMPEKMLVIMRDSE